MILRCSEFRCRASVEVGDGGVNSWRFPLWDHLFDAHIDLIQLDRADDICFEGPYGMRVRVTEAPP